MKTPPRAVSLCACFLAVVAGCETPGVYRDGTFEGPQVRYRVEPPSVGWKQVDFAQADIAFFNAQLEASLLVNSHCKGVQDSPLEALTQQLFFGMTERETLVEERITRSGREGLESTVMAKLDGVPRKLVSFVLKKDGCVYDVVLDTPPQSFAPALPAYQKLRDGIVIEPRKDHGDA